MIFELEKPIYGSCYGIWDKWIKLAKKKNLIMVVNTPHGTATYSSFREWVIGAKKINRYFKNPDVPMIFYSREILEDITLREKRKKAEKKQEVNQVSATGALAQSTDQKRLEMIRRKLGLTSRNYSSTMLI